MNKNIDWLLKRYFDIDNYKMEISKANFIIILYQYENQEKKLYIKSENDKYYFVFPNQWPLQWAPL